MKSLSRCFASWNRFLSNSFKWLSSYFFSWSFLRSSAVFFEALLFSCYCLIVVGLITSLIPFPIDYLTFSTFKALLPLPEVLAYRLRVGCLDIAFGTGGFYDATLGGCLILTGGVCLTTASILTSSTCPSSSSLFLDIFLGANWGILEGGTFGLLSLFYC